MRQTYERDGACAFLISRSLALLALILLVSFCCACSEDDVWIPPRDVPAPYYDTRFFSWNDGRCSYESGNRSSAKTGVDVSEYQGAIDWDAVAADGIDFAIVRIGYRGTTEGGLFTDPLFTQNVSKAQAAGIECGAYFFSQATTVEEALEEAAYVLDLLGGIGLEYPVVFDYEVGGSSRAANLSQQDATEIARAFCDAIRTGGYEAMLYGNRYDLQRFDLDSLSDLELWFAEYGSYPTYESKFVIWQYDNEGVVEGISSGVDLNLDLTSAL